ncbi:MAG: septum formation initiator family protein [Acidobacteria bacterium]|nr:septum formation initiator family protein [Acidobacteriota bacterium]
MNKAANTYWTDSRLATQRPTARAFTPAFQAVGEANVARSAVRRRDLAIPSWAVFCMIMLATFAVCVTVTMRANAAIGTAEQKYEQMNSDVEMIRTTNATLKNQVERLRTDPRAIETAARTRLNMVRANEVVVPLE